jgi:hypothetical protein
MIRSDAKLEPQRLILPSSNKAETHGTYTFDLNHHYALYIISETSSLVHLYTCTLVP